MIRWFGHCSVLCRVGGGVRSAAAGSTISPHQRCSSSSVSGGGRSVATPDEVYTLGNVQPAAIARGRGGRSSFSGHVVTVFGATGYMGRYIVNQLGKIGCQVIIPYRCDPFDVRHLKLMGDLGQILFCQYDIRDQQSVQRAVQHSNVVINLVGRDFETNNFTYEDVNVTGARAISRAVREAGVRRLIHFSALNAAEYPTGHLLKSGSAFLRSKWLGEMAVREEFPDVTVMRPADIWGTDDKFLRRFTGWERRFFNVIGLYRRGEHTVKQPVYCGDVARAVMAIIQDRNLDGQTYDAVGPHRYQLGELVDWIFRVLRRDKTRRTHLWLQPSVLFTAIIKARLLGGLNFDLGLDCLERECVTDTLSGGPVIADLGVELTDLASRIDWELMPYRAEGSYLEQLNEFPRPEPAPTVPHL